VKKHGLKAADGHHAGDMLDITIPASGDLTTKIVNTDITLEKDKPNSVFHDGGTALVVHANKDDYVTDPTGNAGDRIACGSQVARGITAASAPNNRGRAGRRDHPRCPTSREKSTHGWSLVATVRNRSAPTSLRPGTSALPSTSDQANTVVPANSGDTWRPPLIAAM